MSIPFSRAPHIEGANASPNPSDAPNAALLIDFDNVTMGMRSDLSKELKALLGSDVIKGKVTVQRAYADWRRYPQYIVPLSEASVDLIFAPAYGSNKKNATDIRMAIDGIELVFTRPEIGTYILLTGDSDFSSLVLKLKEYGKYVIGVGIQESSSNILVQNCDEYYSYTSLSGLTKSDESDEAATPASDPWGLVSRAVEQMGRRGDVMRSDRLKQVMLDIDSMFDEKSIGFSKFSRFVSEASRKGLIEIRRMENGQYEIVQRKGGKKSDDRKASARGREKKKPEPSAGGRDRARSETTADPDLGLSSPVSRPSAQDRGVLEPAYALLRAAVLELLADMDDDSVRDSDVKRRMLVLQQGFSEADFGFPKFSRFLRQAHDHGVVDLRKSEGGNYRIVLGTGKSVLSERSGSGPLPPSPSDADPPPLLERQVAKRTEVVAVDPERLRLPTGRDSIVKYLSNSYAGVGKRTAETLVGALGDQLFQVLHSNPSRVGELLPPARAARVLAGWKADFQRRSERHVSEGEGIESGSVPVAVAEPSPTEVTQVESRTRRGRRTRGSAAPES